MKLKAGLGALLGQFIAICLSASMKNLLLAAALLTTAAAPALANPVHLFSINTANPRSIDFKGTGTANFNNSTGTQNNFNVGSSTNLGVNGSINATRDYGGTSDGTLQLAGTSVMQQTIGTSGNAANVQAASQAAGLAAYTSANQLAKKSTEEAFGTAYDADKTYKDIEGVTIDMTSLAAGQTAADKWEASKKAYEESKFNAQYASDYATTLEQSQMVGTWKVDDTRTLLNAITDADEKFGTNYTEYKTLYQGGNITEVKAGGGTGGTELTQDQWEANRTQYINRFKRNNEVNQNGLSLADFAAAQSGGGSESSSSSETQEQFGVIKGDFKTTNTASTGSTGSHQEWIDKAREAADGKLGINYADRANGSQNGNDANGVALDNGDTKFGVDFANRTSEYTATSQADWEAAKAKHAEDAWTTAWNTAFDSAYKDRQKDSTFNESVSVVTVTGVGNIANVNASGQSKFNVNLSPREIPSYESQVAALNGSVISTAADGTKTITSLGAAGAAGTAVTAQPIIFPEENGSASGSSGASLSTSSYANQSNSESASAFIQAFAASNAE